MPWFFDVTAGSPRIDRSTSLPSVSSFSAVADFTCRELANYGLPFQFFSTSPLSEYIGWYWDSGGLFKAQRQITGSYSETASLFTLAVGDRIRACGVNDGTNFTTYYIRNDGAFTVGTALSLGGTPMAGSAGFGWGGVSLSSSSWTAAIELNNTALFSGQLVQQEIEQYLRSGGPPRRDDCLFWNPQRYGFTPYINYAQGGAADCALTGIPLPLPDLPILQSDFPELGIDPGGFSGTGSASPSAFDVTASGHVAEFFGPGSGATSPFGSTGSGSEDYTGTGSEATSPFGASASGLETFAGSVSAAGAPFAITATGVESFDASASAAEQPFAASGSGLETFAGTVSATESPFAVSGSGTVSSTAITGTGSAAMSPFGAVGSSTTLYTVPSFLGLS